MNYMREANVAVTNQTRWALTRIVRAQSQVGEALSVPATVDALADQILAAWIAQTHPELPELWKQREQLDTQAEARVSERKV